MITMNDVIEHLKDPNEHIAFGKSRLSKNGLLFITTPNSNSWIGKIMGKGWGVYDGNEHMVIFSEHSMNRLLERHGLRVLTIKTHFKSLTIAYFIRMALQWQFKMITSSTYLPYWIGSLPLRITVGEMLVVAKLNN